MDVLEKDKLQWMTDMSRPLSCPALDRIDARFSLTGDIIPRGADLPSHLGLHHHGEEAEVSYTPHNVLCFENSSLIYLHILIAVSSVLTAYIILIS